MKHIPIIILTYAALVLETTWPQLFPETTFRMQLLPFVLVLALCWCNCVAAICWAGVIGLLADTLSAKPLGIEMMSAIAVMCLLQYLIALYHKNSHIGSLSQSWPVLLVIAVSVLATFGMVYFAAVLKLLWQQQPNLIVMQFSSLLPTCLCSTMFGITLWLLCRGTLRSALSRSY